MTQALQHVHTCNLCGGIVRADRGFIVCYGCGDVKDRDYRQSNYVESTNAFVFDSSQFVDKSHRPNVLNGNGSDIGFHRQKLYDVKFRKLRIYHRRTQMLSERIYRALRKLNHVCGVLQISNFVRDRACTIMRQALPAWDADGTNNIIILALGSLVVAVKLHKVPITDSEVMDIWSPGWREKQSSDKTNYTSLNRAKFFLRNTVGITFFSPKPIDFIPRVISSFRQSEEIQARLESKSIDPDEYFWKLECIARRVLNVTTSYSRRPLALAASCCYAFDPAKPAFNKKGVLTQRAVGEALGNPGLEYTIRDHYAELWKPMLLKEESP